MNSAGGRAPLIFIRHGETDWNRAERFQGRQDIPLNERGRRQAARNGRAIAGILREGMGAWRLVASPMRRAVETMEIVLAAAESETRRFERDAELVEVSYGEWEGLTLAEMTALDPAAMAARDADKWGHVPPSGESYAMLARRVARSIAGFDGPTLMVAHGGVLRALHHLLAGLPSHDAPRLATPQDCVTLFTRTAVMTI